MANGAPDFMHGHQRDVERFCLENRMPRLTVFLFVFSIAFAMLFSGCAGAGHAGTITRDGGLEAACGGGCAEFNADGTGCAKFNASTSDSCASYFETLCKASPEQCSTDTDG